MAPRAYYLPTGEPVVRVVEFIDNKFFGRCAVVEISTDNGPRIIPATLDDLGVVA